MSRSYCLIPDASGQAILAVSAGDGRWTLPAFEHGPHWFAYAAVALAHAASAHFGTTMTALHERHGGDVCELEIQAPDWRAPADTRWITRDDLALVTPASLSDAVRAWFDEQKNGIPAIRTPWERRGWHAQAERWILSTCAKLGITPSGPVEQVKAAWSLSAILRVNTPAGMLYFKADAAKPPSEPAIIQALAQRWPRHVPAIVAADPQRGWMLTRDFGGHTLHNELAHSQAAVRRFAEIQIACSAGLEPWRQLHCPDLGIPVLVQQMDRLLDDPAALRMGEPGGLTKVEAARLRDLTPRLHGMWRELAAIPIPATLVQQDFRHDNLVLCEGAYLFYDWSDTVIGHPFFSFCRFLDFLSENSPDGPHLTDAYLEPWKEILEEAQLRRAFALTQRLQPIYLAIRWRLDAPWCEPDSYWGRILRERPATELRRLLRDMSGEMVSPGGVEPPLQE